MDVGSFCDTVERCPVFADHGKAEQSQPLGEWERSAELPGANEAFESSGPKNTSSLGVFGSIFLWLKCPSIEGDKISEHSLIMQDA